MTLELHTLLIRETRSVLRRYIDTEDPPLHVHIYGEGEKFETEHRLEERQRVVAGFLAQNILGEIKKEFPPTHPPQDEQKRREEALMARYQYEKGQREIVPLVVLTEETDETLFHRLKNHQKGYSTIEYRFKHTINTDDSRCESVGCNWYCEKKKIPSF